MVRAFARLRQMALFKCLHLDLSLTIIAIMLVLDNLPNPKRDRSSAVGRAGWYPYYAGFSSDFAQAVLDYFVKSASSRVLDPWNGSGTTTAVTAGKGHEGFGFDLNPVMVVVARARLLNKRERSSLLPLAKLITSLAVSRHEVQSDDPLNLWFKPQAIGSLRRIEQGLQKSLFGLDKWVPMQKHIQANDFSDIAAFFYVALFRTIRAFLTRFESSNPTWIKAPKGYSTKLEPSERTIRDQFLMQISSMISALDSDVLEKDGKIKIGLAASQRVPLPDSSIDFILSSPPYCTRIDYASATRVELAVLGLSEGDAFENLRRSLLGTPTVPPEAPACLPGWGPTCESFLRAVKEHTSKASSTYYYKGHCQYFDGIYNSMLELHRCLKPSGQACLVVQDSFYKDVHNNLPTIYAEMAESMGINLTGRKDFPLSRSMGQVNVMSRRYRTSGAATESVLLFTKD